MDDLTTETGPSRARRVLVPTLVAMMAAGAALSLDFFVALPTALVTVAVVVAGAGLAVFLVAGWIHARSTGAGLLRSAWGAFRRTVRLAFDLF